MTFTGGAPAVVGQILSKIDSVVAQKQGEFTTNLSGAMAETGTKLNINPAGRLLIPSIPLATSTFVPVERQFTTLQVDRKLAEEMDRVADTLADAFETCLSENFPQLDTYTAAAESWLSAALAGGTGVSTVVEDAIWARERARTLREAARLTDEVATTWLARGFALPPGALVHQAAVIDREAAEKISESSRERAIKTWDLEIENVRLAMNKAMEVRTTAVGAALDYMKALAVAPELGLRITQNVQAVHQKLNDVLVQLYDADMTGREFNLKLKNIDIGREVADNEANLSSEKERRGLRVQAAIAAFQAIGAQAASALNGLHAQASISGSDITSTSIQG